MLFENISAISTPIGVGGVAIIRVSGDSALAVAQKMFKPSGKVQVKDFEPYKLYPGEIDCGSFTDFGMCVYFRSPRSYTGEEMVEFHCHGGVAITRGVLRRTLELGCKIAGRGEFTKRAFLNGKLSLSSCEGLADMINSESEGEVKAGYYLYKERLTREIRHLQQGLKEVLSLVDVNIDFPEEGVEEAEEALVLSRLKEIRSRLLQLISTYSVGRKVKSGVKVAIVGKPNTGKSSLLNALLYADKAIVSPIAGTTRDVVEGTLVNDGVRYEFFDTAGIRECADEIEAEGINRSRRALEDCDVAVVVLDGSEELEDEDRDILSLAEGKPVIVVCNKSDVGYKGEKCDLVISAKNGDGVKEVLEQIKQKVFGGEVDLSGDVICEERHFYALKGAYDSLTAAIEAVGVMPLDATAVDITEAWQTLGEITGETAAEDIIADIFAKFCVGK